MPDLGLVKLQALSPEDKRSFTERWRDATSQIAGSVTGSQLAISDLYALCGKLFHALCAQGDALPAGVPVSGLQNEMARFRLWGEELITSDLDNVLEKYEDMTLQIADLLLNVGECLIKELLVLPSSPQIDNFALDLAANRRLLETCQNGFITDDKEEGGYGEDFENDTEGSKQGSSLETGDEGYTFDQSDLISDLAFETTCLLELTPTIKDCLARANDYKIPEHVLGPFVISNPAYPYVQVVRDKFPNASASLVARLGEANWQRHIRLRCTMEFIDDEEAQISEEKTAPDLVKIPEASIFGIAKVPEPQSLFHDSGIGTMQSSSISYAQSIKSHSSFVSSVGNNDRGSLKVPTAPPQVAAGKSFLCEYCRKTQHKIRNNIDWKRHFFSDLIPYICTFEDCPSYLEQFRTRDLWADHEFSIHRGVYSQIGPMAAKKMQAGPPDDLFYVDSKSAGLDHTTSGMQASDNAQCLICKSFSTKDTRELKRHVCQHMEEVALMALPTEPDAIPGNEDQSSPPHSPSEVSSTSQSHIKARTGEKSPTSPSERDSPKQGDEDESPIKCICGYTHDDGSSIFCERCETWQHTECYYYDQEKDRIPTTDELDKVSHLCKDCEPRFLDVSAAFSRQKNRGKALHEDHDKPKKPHATKVLGKSRGPSFLKTKYSSTFMHLYEHDPGESDQMANLYRSLSLIQDLSTWAVDVDALLEATRGFSHAEIFFRTELLGGIVVAPSTLQKETEEESRVTIDGRHPRWILLTTNSFIKCNSIVGELKGTIGLLSDYVPDPENRWDWLRHPAPFVFFHPKLPIYIDTRSGGTIHRYLRRSCRPNLSMLTFLENDTDYRFYFSAREDIEPGAELTIGWTIDEHMRKFGSGRDDLSADGKEYYTAWVDRVSSEFGGCHCGRPDDCWFVRYDPEYQAMLKPESHAKRQKRKSSRKKTQ